jgi:hypothetical protein
VALVSPHHPVDATLHYPSSTAPPARPEALWAVDEVQAGETGAGLPRTITPPACILGAREDCDADLDSGRRLIVAGWIVLGQQVCFHTEPNLHVTLDVNADAVGAVALHACCFVMGVKPLGKVSRLTDVNQVV